MAFQPWEYRTESGFTGEKVDLIGYSIAATDGDIGRIDEATYETGSSYLVVDTGPWIFGRKVMLPAGVVEGSTPRIGRSTSTGRRTRSRTRRSSTISPMTPHTGTGSAATTPRRMTPQTPGSDPGRTGTTARAHRV